MENTGFNQGQYSSFTPNVTKQHNGNILGALLVTALAVSVGLIVYNELSKRDRIRQEN